MSVKQWKVSEPWLKASCKLGEGPFYEPDSHMLRFVDIVSKKFHFVDLAKGPSSLSSLDLTDAVGCSADIEGEEGKTLIVGAKYGYAYMDRRTGALAYITKPSQLWNAPGEDVEEKSKSLRANDGNLDPQGRFWLGMMTDPSVKDIETEGAVFVLEQDGSVRRAIDKVTIPNGIGWTEDGKNMYFVDSTTKTIWAYDFDGTNGNISNRRAWWKTPSDWSKGAVPDGFCQDTEGGIWQAIYGGSRVVRLKDNGQGQGEIVGEVLLPARCPTCPRIVGTSLYVTSAEEGKPDRYPESVEHAGAVFKVDIGVTGIDMKKWQRKHSAQKL